MGKTRFLRHLPAFILFGAILIWRFYQIRNLVLPAWVDSVHHTLLVRILLEQGTVPDSWAPYLPQVPFYYHFGFHVTAALFSKITGITAAQSVLWVGQIWQGALTLCVYILAYILWKNPLKALTAMILVGFVSQMPAYYTTWGRYTLLAGLTILIAGMAAALAGRKIILALLVAAAAITHYYAFLLLGLFLFIAVIVHPKERQAILTSGIIGILIASPWLWRVFVQVNNHNLVYVETGKESVGYSVDYLWYLLGPTRNYILLALALAGIIISVVRITQSHILTQSALFPLICWSVTIVALMGPWRLGPFRPDQHAAIALFLPVALFATEALWQLKKPLFIWAAVLVLAFWGIVETKNIINPATILANKEDVAALEWIEANTPRQATFFIDVAPWSAQWRGIDGGWWITPITGRPTMPPPAAYGWGNPESIRQIRSTAAQIYGLSWLDGAEYCQKLTALMQQNKAAYYFSRSTGVKQCASFKVVYQGGNDLSIYKINSIPITTELQP